MEQRKFFSHKITELEDIYSNSSNDFAILEELEEELQLRKTARAKKLLKNVQESLNSDVGKNDIKPKSKVKCSDKSQSSKKKINWNELKTSESANIDVEIDFHQGKVLNNKPSDILDTWTVLEALSPQSYKKPKDLVIGNGSYTYLKNGLEPWMQGEKSRPSNNLYYLVYLGAIDLEKASDELLKIYQDKRAERSQAKGLAAIGVIILDKKGVPLPDNGIVLSSFAWAYARALTGNLSQLKFWESAETILKEGLEKIVYDQDENGEILPFSLNKALDANKWLIENCEIPVHDTVAPSFAVRLYQPFKKGEPDAPLLNSFFLDDLQKAKHAFKQDLQGKALSEYLGMIKPSHQYDVLENKSHLEKALQPKNMPLGRWPSKGRHSLALLQQSAINLAIKKLEVGSGSFSVNGPPGTGKTTMLRDVVASVLVNRSRSLCLFEDPEKAFIHAGKIKLGGGFAHLYQLHESLRGHEILVASSNNKAVENISKELPLKEQIAEDIKEFNYFKTVSNALNQDHSDTWGLIASVLGNSKNRNNFNNKVWWDKNSGLRNYFMSITGQTNFELDDNGEEIIPLVIQECDPPKSIEEAKQRWNQARKHFVAALRASENINHVAQEAYECLVLMEELENQIKEIKGIITDQNEALEAIKLKKEELHADLQGKQVIRDKFYQLLYSSAQSKPGIFRMLFFRKEWKQWKSNHSDLTIKSENANSIFKKANFKYERLSEEKKKIEQTISSLGAERNELKNKYKLKETKINQASQVCGGKLVTKELWKKTHEDQQVFTPNFTAEAQRLRDDVFIAAIRLHKAFIDASVKKIRQNLGVFFNCLSGGALPHDKEHLLPHLWSSLFLLTPVVSTAFASVGRMLKTMPKESIGWLLIDEAGQATPQAAIGAILRSKRVISVGDPLQIEPIVSLSPSLIDGISKHMGVDPHQWTAPDASVQTVSDKANEYGTTIPRDLSEIRIGTPLLVHRRCENPMFLISNKLAYNGLMVHATAPSESKITEVLGIKYAWFDIKGCAEEKWCPEEGECVSKLFLKVCEQNANNPDIFVITPFRHVAFRMRQRMNQEIELMKNYGVKDPNSLIANSIGTVHTFQGKEAKAVILLLGAPSPSQSGARVWATSKVNILNVAVSRAKQNFYVVGNKELWGSLGNMKTVSRYLNS